MVIAITSANSFQVIYIINSSQLQSYFEIREAANKFQKFSHTEKGFNIKHNFIFKYTQLSSSDQCVCVWRGEGTLSSDRPLQLVGVKITKSCRNMLEVAGQASQTHYHSISGEILPHFYVKNTFLAQKLTKLGSFKEIS